MPQGIAERAALAGKGRGSGRRSRIVKSILLMGFIAFGLVAFLVWQGDERTRKAHRAIVEKHLHVLQAELDRLEQLPANLPSKTRGGGRRSKYIYLDDAVRYYARKTGQPVIALASSRVHQLLKADGRFVIIMENKKLRIEWRTEAEYDKAWADQHRAAVGALSAGGRRNP